MSHSVTPEGIKVTSLGGEKAWKNAHLISTIPESFPSTWRSQLSPQQIHPRLKNGSRDSSGLCLPCHQRPDLPGLSLWCAMLSPYLHLQLGLWSRDTGKFPVVTGVPAGLSVFPHLCLAANTQKNAHHIILLLDIGRPVLITVFKCEQFTFFSLNAKVSNYKLHGYS